jgi:hypothetical protein
MTNIATPTYTAGQFANALTLNGTTQALQAGSDTTSANTTMKLGDSNSEFTIGMWFKISATGAYRTLFQSYSVNTNVAGIKLLVNTSNVLAVNVGNNTSPSVYTNITGLTVVTDNTWHYVVWTYRNNYSQIYLDGKLECYGWTYTPAYAATNYVRIGCGNSAGTNSDFWSGQIDDMFIMSGVGAAIDEYTVRAKYIANTAQGLGDLTLNEKGVCSLDAAMSGSDTLITVYTGTDYMFQNATISNPYYSPLKAPYGFPLSKNKWSVNITESRDVVLDPAANTYYNLGSYSISVPKGSWTLDYRVLADTSKGASAVGPQRFGLSTLTTVHTDFDLVSCVYHGSNVANISLRTVMIATKDIKLYAKTTYYLVAVTESDDVAMGINGTRAATVIRAVSTLI